MVSMLKKKNNIDIFAYLGKHWVELLIIGGVLGGLFYAVSFSPGGMSTDSIDQFAQAVGDRQLHDWHPPIMAWFWGVLISVTNHPGSLHIFMTTVFAVSIALLAVYIYKRSNSKRLSLAPFVLFIIPTVSHFLPMVWKDTYMMELLLLAVVLLLWVRYVTNKILLRVIIATLLLLIFLSFCLRYNAVFAIIPIFVYALKTLLPKIKNWVLIFITIASIGVTILAQSIINGPILNARETNPSASIMLDDLMHIPLNTKDGDSKVVVETLNAVKKSCNVWDEIYFYNIIWKCLSDEQIKVVTSTAEGSISSIWIRSVLSSPIEYVKYRLATYKAFLFNEPTDGYDTTIIPNEYGLEFKGRLLAAPVIEFNKFIFRDFGFSYRVYFWLGASLIGLLAVYLHKTHRYRREIIMLLSSSALYIIGYFPMMISIEIRYILWSVVATILAWMLYIIGKIKSHND